MQYNSLEACEETLPSVFFAYLIIKEKTTTTKKKKKKKKNQTKTGYGTSLPFTFNLTILITFVTVNTNVYMKWVASRENGSFTLLTWSIQAPSSLTVHFSNFKKSIDVSKTAGWVANSVDANQTPHSVASERGLHYNRLSLSRSPRESLKYFEISELRHIRFARKKKRYNK